MKRFLIYDISLAVSPFNNPTDISVDSSGRLYILDSGNSRLIIVNDEMPETIISDFDGEKFTNANGITISDSGDIYIADTDNKRILIGDINGHLKKKIHCPNSEIIPDDFEFLPMQMTVDKNDYLYVLCKGSYYGALVFAPDGTTDGFFGANLSYLETRNKRVEYIKAAIKEKIVLFGSKNKA